MRRQAKTAVGAAMVAAAVLGLVPAGAARAGHVPEVEKALAGLTVEPPRTHKNMLVFPIRWSGRQAPGRWETLDAAVAGGRLKVEELPQASVPQVKVTNTGEGTVFLMSGEILSGGKQTRVIRKDTIVEPKQTVQVPVFCVERGRWAGGKTFRGAPTVAPASIQQDIKRGAGQGRVWDRVRQAAPVLGAESPTESLDEMLRAPATRRKFGEVHKDLGEFSPPDTVGLAVADARTGRVVGIEMFGRRDLFKGLQQKLVEGYAADLVLTVREWDPASAKKVAKDAVLAFVKRALQGQSTYEDTPGSGRGLALESGSVVGKGVALGEVPIHLSVQDIRPAPTPARPVVRPQQPRPVPVPRPVRPPVRPPRLEPMPQR